MGPARGTRRGAAAPCSVGRAADALGEAGLWRLLARGWLLLAAALASCAELGEAAALLVVGAAEALVLVPAYPLLALASPDAGAVAAVFNGAWAVGQGLGPFLTVLPWASVMRR